MEWPHRDCLRAGAVSLGDWLRGLPSGSPNHGRSCLQRRAVVGANLRPLPQNSPAEWIAEGHVTTCQACGHRGADVRPLFAVDKPSSGYPAHSLKVLGNPAYRFKRIGLEAGPLSQWLFSGLAEAGLPIVCVETRHMQADDRTSDIASGPKGTTSGLRLFDHLVSAQQEDIGRSSLGLGGLEIDRQLELGWVAPCAAADTKLNSGQPEGSC